MKLYTLRPHRIGCLSGRSQRFRAPQAVVLSVVLFLVACRGDVPVPPERVVRDSSGVTVVESFVPIWQEDEEWAVASTPDVTIGRINGGDEYVLDNVAAVRRFRDGRIAVLDGGSSRVRVYSPAGEHLFDVGGEGEGPSELSGPQFLHLLGDTIVVYEVAPATITMFQSDGSFIRTTRLADRSDGTPLFGYAFGVLDQTSVAVAAIQPGPPAAKAGRARGKMTVWRAQLDGAETDSLTEIESEEVLVHPSGRWNDVPFGKTTYYAASDDRVYLGDSGYYSIRVMNSAGRLVRVLRRATEPRPVRAEHLRRYAEQVVAATTEDEESIPVMVKRLSELGAAETMPALRLLVPDRAGNLWVEDWDDVGVDQGRFSVFRGDGAWLGRVALPPGLPWRRGTGMRTGALEIGDDYLLGVFVGQLGTEEVRLYQIIKPDGGG